MQRNFKVWLMHREKNAVKRNYPCGSPDTGLTRQRLSISYFQHVQRTKGKHAKRTKGQIIVSQQMKNIDKEKDIF